MNLCLVRHAIAEERAPEREDDRRALTARGRARFQASVRGMQRLGLSFERIYFSPLLRAQETADLLAELCSGELQVTPHLARSVSPALLDELAGEDVALVGHEPHLSELAAWLVLGGAPSETRDVAPFAFKKGGIALLQGEARPGRMSVRAFYPPATLRALARL
jgi:phosphohistidine phosphatase